MKKRKGELYRDPQEGKVAGVCAGVAEYFGWEVWLIRILLVSAVLLAGPLFVMGYIAAWFILDKKPMSDDTYFSERQSQGKGWHSTDDEHSMEVKSRVWRAGESPSRAFNEVRNKMNHLEGRLRGMETYVTSSEFQLHREINKL